MYYIKCKVMSSKFDRDVDHLKSSEVDGRAFELRDRRSFEVSGTNLQVVS